MTCLVTLFDRKVFLCLITFFGIFITFVLLKVTCLVALFDRKIQVLQKLARIAIFNEVLATQNVNVANFARSVEWDFLFDF